MFIVVDGIKLDLILTGVLEVRLLTKEDQKVPPS